MSNSLPSNQLDLLRSILGASIFSVMRQIFKSDFDLQDYQKNADGPIELKFDTVDSIYFDANAEGFSVGVNAGGMPRYGESYVLSNVGRNSFWSDKINQKICNISYLKSSDFTEDYPCEFGIRMHFENGSSVVFEYVDEMEFPDTLRIVEKHDGNNHEEVFVE